MKATPKPRVSRGKTTKRRYQIYIAEDAQVAAVEMAHDDEVNFSRLVTRLIRAEKARREKKIRRCL